MTFSPVYKSGDRTTCHNYRTISLLTTVSKVFVKVIQRRVIYSCNKYKLISEKQYVFREAKSTQDAIAYLNSKKFIDEKMPDMRAFVDIAKAFDTVGYQELLSTLENYGSIWELFMISVTSSRNRPMSKWFQKHILWSTTEYCTWFLPFFDLY